MRSGNNVVNGFTLNEINQMIEIIATDYSRLSMYSVRGYNIHYYYYVYVFIIIIFLNINCIPCEYEINYIYIISLRVFCCKITDSECFQVFNLRLIYTSLLNRH